MKQEKMKINYVKNDCGRNPDPRINSGMKKLDENQDECATKSAKVTTEIL